MSIFQSLPINIKLSVSPRQCQSFSLSPLMSSFQSLRVYANHWVSSHKSQSFSLPIRDLALVVQTEFHITEIIILECNSYIFKICPKKNLNSNFLRFMGLHE